MRVYLDCCCLQRPLDDQAQHRIRIETDAVLTVLAAIESGTVTLLNSEIFDFEISRIKDDQRRKEATAILTLASERVSLTDEIERLARSLERDGVKPIDALHLASASVATADFFITCDDHHLKKGQALANLQCKVDSVLALAKELAK